MAAIIRSIVVGAALLGLVACVGTEQASSRKVQATKAAPPVKPFAFKYDFEDGRALDLKPLAANGKFTVNSMGITDEKAFAGGKSFKFDVTCESGNYFAWMVSFNVPAESRLLRMSYRCQVMSSGKGQFGPGVSLFYPAIGSANGADYFAWINTTDGGWSWMDSGDLGAYAKGRIVNRAWEIKPVQVTGDVKGMVICFRGMAPGERLVLYIDNLAVEGETPELAEEFNRRAIEQWLPVKERHFAAIQQMRDAINYDSRFLAACVKPSPAAALLQQAARTHLADWSAIAQAATGRGYLLNEEVAAAAGLNERINDLMANVAMLEGYDFTK